jgi:ribonucleoside-diphosphate reductase alpha chain
MENLESKSMSVKKPTYSFEEAKRLSTEYFKGDKLAGSVFVDKYALKDSYGNLYEQTPDDMHDRLAGEISRIEQKYPNPMSKEDIYELLKNFKYIIPQGGPMTGIGNDYQIASLSNCFVIGNTADSYGGIMKTDQEQVQLMKRRGGVGHDLSHIRPASSPVLNSALTSTGIVPFMERYSNSTREVAQDGRRGALMLSVSIKHPDAEKFIDAKLEQNKITGANISVRIDDKFMNAVKENKKYTQNFPIDSDNPTHTHEIEAKKLWDKIVHNAWKSAEPGVLFWDTIINESIPDCYADKGYKTTSTNPCGEIPLCPYDSCRLLAVNLYSYVNNPFTNKAEFNFPLFKKHVHYAQRIADDIIDAEIEKIDLILNKINKDPEDEEMKRVEIKLWENIKHKAVEGRRTGTGITAEGDMLAALGLKYGSDEGNDFSEKVHKTFAIEAYHSSVNMVKEGRKSFEIYDSEKEKDNPFIKRLFNEDSELEEDMKKYGRRNISLLTIAPTGTTSLMTQTTSGIEPVFLPAYRRKKKIDSNSKKNRNIKVAFKDEMGDEWEEFTVFHHKFEDWLKINGYDIEEVKEYGDYKLNELVKKSPYYQATSNDVDWIKKIELQGKVQKWVDHSISVTVNLPNDVSEELVGKVYMKGWEIGCKGITVYRDGSREGVMEGIKDKKNLVTLVQNNVKLDRRIQMKPQAIKYKVKRAEDSLHFVLTSDLYIDEKNKKAYFIPDEDFQVRAPSGMATSISFSQAGIDRTDAFRGGNPNYAEMISRLQSVFSNELEGIGPTLIKSIEHSAGLVFEDYFLRNGIIGRDEKTGKLINLVEKNQLKKVDSRSDLYKQIMSQVKISDEEEITINGNNGKLDNKFSCESCGGTNYTTKDGCSNPVCTSCGWSDPNKSCG